MARRKAQEGTGIRVAADNSMIILIADDGDARRSCTGFFLP
jgi:hypothetical protein